MASGNQPARRLERRWAPRYPFRADLEIEWGSAILRGSTRDISANGMFIEAPDTLWVGAGFTARMNLSQPVKLNCFVKRIEPGRGMGVTIALAESESQKLYHDLLSSLSPAPAEGGLY
jgi:PilZ domain-containing protein